MLDVQRLKRLEDLQNENRRLTEKLSELAVSIAALKLIETLGALRPANGSDW
jgi:hypothetical protein